MTLCHLKLCAPVHHGSVGTHYVLFIMSKQTFSMFMNEGNFPVYPGSLETYGLNEQMNVSHVMGPQWSMVGLK